MSYQTPKDDWSESDTLQPLDINRIEANIKYLAGNGGEQQLGKTDSVEFADIDCEDVTCDSVTSSGTVSGTTGAFNNITASGTITDKNGNEVLAMRAEYKEGSNSGSVSGGYVDVIVSLSYSNNVQGVAQLDVHAYQVTSSALDYSITDINISGSTVSVYIRMYGGTEVSTSTAKVHCTALTD